MSECLVINIINFIRAMEPRRDMDLLEPVVEQLALARHYRYPCTWLLQYDALVAGPWTGLLQEHCSAVADQEIGGWFEIVQPLVEEAGLTWRGRYPWDWHSHVGFSVGYTPAEREKLIDVYMADFKRLFGRYPASMGSWLIDIHSLSYMHDQYGVSGSCNCKDQYGTDGYTLWGGYWNQGYYPSRKNMFVPAQTEEAQLPVPVFRMLGSDPIDQYDAGLYDGHNCTEVAAQSVVSLEPVYTDGGGNQRWVRWFFEELRNNPCLAFQYAQVGQENSFGWPAMAEGYRDQMALLDQLRRDNDHLRIETLEETSRWFRQTYPLTPPSAIAARRDARGHDRGSAWYNSRFYRTNIYWGNGSVCIRDLHLFDEAYTERYHTDICPSAAATYDTLPLCEGFLWSDDTTRSGLWMLHHTEPLSLGVPVLNDSGNGEFTITWHSKEGTTAVTCREDALFCHFPAEQCQLSCTWAEGKQVPFISSDGKRIQCRHEGHHYAVTVMRGSVELDIMERVLRLIPDANGIAIGFGR